ncbi:hypothetical protein A5795_002254, partial [Enterococcus faecalis]
LVRSLRVYYSKLKRKSRIVNHICVFS